MVILPAGVELPNGLAVSVEPIEVAPPDSIPTQQFSNSRRGVPVFPRLDSEGRPDLDLVNKLRDDALLLQADKLNSYEVNIPYTFESLLRAIDSTAEAAKLAMIARQTKIEKFLLAEIMYRGNKAFNFLDFYLE